jgi:hypothetical protein
MDAENVELPGRRERPLRLGVHDEMLGDTRHVDRHQAVDEQRCRDQFVGGHLSLTPQEPAPKRMPPATVTLI